MMKCPKCQQPLEDTAVVCPFCGDCFAQREQEERVGKARAQIQVAVREACRHPLISASAILSTVVTVLNVPFLPSFICSLITTVGLWQLRSAESEKEIAARLRRIRVYDVWMYVLLDILLVVGLIVFFVPMWVSGDAELLSGKYWLLGIGFVGIFALPLVIIQLPFLERKRFFKNLADIAEKDDRISLLTEKRGITENTDFERQGVSWVSYLGGGVTLLIGLILLGLPLFASVLTALTENTALAFLSGAMWLLGILLFSVGCFFLAHGFYAVCMAVWGRKLSRTMLRLGETLVKERKQLSDLEEITRQETARIEAERQKAEEEKARVAEEKRQATEAEWKRQQEELRLQQQQILQLLAQQMREKDGQASSPQEPSQEG